MMNKKTTKKMVDWKEILDMNENMQDADRHIRYNYDNLECSMASEVYRKIDSSYIKSTHSGGEK